ncbi:hypothetical protein CHUUTOTORO_01370 [Serratia phage vB_SmaM-ChuuTotoro]|nr:hypothetical protein CHUUTOTORO_01370 [Serratia phage vB_SmaM-ChuuTotoro]
MRILTYGVVKTIMNDRLDVLTGTDEALFSSAIFVPIFKAALVCLSSHRLRTLSAALSHLPSAGDQTWQNSEAASHL